VGWRVGGGEGFAWYRAAIMASLTCSRGASNTTRPSRRPTMRGKWARAMSTWCRLHTSVAPRAAASCCSVVSVIRQRRVERRQRLVDQQHLGRRQQQARQGAALALAAGQAVHARIQFVAQAETGQGLPCAASGSSGVEQRTSGRCHKLQCGRRAASTAVTTR
jgi:hypothetical protein